MSRGWNCEDCSSGRAKIQTMSQRRIRHEAVAKEIRKMFMCLVPMAIQHSERTHIAAAAAKVSVNIHREKPKVAGDRAITSPITRIYGWGTPSRRPVQSRWPNASKKRTHWKITTVFASGRNIKRTSAMNAG